MKYNELEVLKDISANWVVPYLTFGSGEPIISITSYVHGDEDTGLLLLEKLHSTFNNLTKGTIRYILTSNPLAQKSNSRTGYDEVNMNRVFPGKNVEPACRISKKLFDLISDSSLVIDFHLWKRLRTPAVLIMQNEKSDVGDKVKLFSKLFQPGCIWALDFSNDSDAVYTGTLFAQLCKDDIPSFVVETSYNFGDIENEIDACETGVKRILSHFGMIKYDFNFKSLNDFTFLNGNMIYSDYSGVFIPMRNVLDNVKKYDLIAKIFNPKENKYIEILSPDNGQIMQLAWKQVVREGDQIFNLGVK